MAPRRALGQAGRELQQYLVKGKQIYVEGRLQTRQWDDKDGNKRYTTEIKADRITLLGERRAAAGAARAVDRGGDFGQRRADARAGGRARGRHSVLKSESAERSGADRGMQLLGVEVSRS